MANKTYSKSDIALGVLGALGLFAAALKDVEVATESKGVVSTEKVKQTAIAIVQHFKERAKRDTTMLKWSKFDHIRVEDLDDLDAIEEDVKHMILMLAEATSRSFHGIQEVKWALMSVNYDVESSAVFNRLDVNNITLKDAEAVYIVWLGLKIAREQATVIDDIDIF